MRHSVRKDTRKLIREEHHMIAQSCKDNPKQFWRYVRTKTAVCNTMGNIKQTKPNGESISISDDTEKCKAFSDYFSGVHTQ